MKNVFPSPVFSITLWTALASMAVAQITPGDQHPPTRPPLEKRKFTSEAVEKEILRVTSAIADPEVAWIFQACYPNTLDTTVHFSDANGKPDTYIITGDINAMWLRDSSAQVQGYIPLCKEDRHLAENDLGAHSSAGSRYPNRSLRECFSI